MLGDGGDDADQCSNVSTAQKYREPTTEERATYRSWMRGIVVFYCAVLLVVGIAIAGYSKTGLTQLTNLSVRKIGTSSGAN